VFYVIYTTSDTAYFYYDKYLTSSSSRCTKCVCFHIYIYIYCLLFVPDNSHWSWGGLAGLVKFSLSGKWQIHLAVLSLFLCV